TSTYIVLYILLLLVFFITFSLYMPCFAQWASRFFPKSQRRHMLELLHKIHQTANAFLRTRLIVAATLSVLFSVGWAFADVPYWFLLGTISGILSIIPYAAGIGWFVALLFNILEAEPNTSAIFYSVLWPSVVYAAVQFMEGWFLTPYLQSEKLDIHPVTVLFVVLAGGVLGGILGMLIAIPLTAAFKIVYNDVIESKLLKWADNN
ncbi:MAG TPA: AI-2E family transporter, partial [Bacteroidales bacterium]|nr:AI-2E family transporter [Bacteroidales bacterium]